MPNSVGKTNKDVRKFLRECGVPPTVANVERIGREIRRTEAEGERVEKIHREIERETGRPALIDERGDVGKRVKAHVQREMAKREKRH